MPISQGRASVATWDLSLMFRTKEQMTSLIEDILKDEVSWNFSFREDQICEGDGVTRTVFFLDIEGMSWANNLLRLAAYIEKQDRTS